MITDNYILAARGVCKSYKMGQVQLEVLKGVDLEIANGEFIAIIGASGSGKSSLLHLLGALDKPDAGEVTFNGKNLAKFKNSQLNKFRNETVGFVFQFYHLLDELNVMENATVPAMAAKSVLSWLTAGADAKKRAKKLLARLELAERIKHKPYQLSGGERQRVAIARALINQPKLLLADEPTGNLDSATGNAILDVFSEINADGQTIVMVTHDERIAARASRVVILADGKIVK